MVGDQRFHAVVEIAGEKFVGLLDSGAEVSVVGPRFRALVERGRVRTKPSVYTLRTADGSTHATSQTLILEVNYQERVHTIEAPMMDGLRHDMILGVDFWRLFGIRPVIKEVDGIEVEKCVNVSDAYELSTEQAQDVQNVLVEMPFCKAGILSKTTITKHSINTGDARPIKQSQYVISPYVQREVHEEIDRLLAIGAIFPCTSPWNNPMIAVRKANGKVRLCLDARRLNAVTEKDAYPQPRINRILSQLSATYVLSSIDLSDAYHQVELDESSRIKTAFSISGKGFFAYSRMPFGLCNSGATLCRLVDMVLGCDLEPNVFVYMDDVIIATETVEQHISLLRIIAKRLSSAGLTISPSKSRFCMRRLKYLGHIVGGGTIRPDPDRIAPIVEYPVPRCAKDVRRLLGMAEWYRRFIPNYADISTPLSDLLKKGRVFAWSDRANKAFEDVKKVLVSEPVLSSPDYTQPFILQTDASDFGIGGVLVQGTGELERVVAYFSQKLSATQRKYQTTERECLAVIVAIEKFRPYIEGSHFTVVTDHASLVWLQNLKDPAGRLSRWALRLQPYDFKIVHRPGRQMVVADALSRAVESIDIETFSQTQDRWYRSLIENVQKDPAKYAQYDVRNGLLYKHCSHSTKTHGRDNWRLVVPIDKRMEVLRQSHDDPMSAHGGRHKTIDRVNRRYYWPRMYEQITKYVRDCDVCRATKAPNVTTRATMGERIEAGRPWQTLYADFVGPFPRSKGGFTYLLVVVDAFSKFVHIHPMRVATARGMMRFLENNIFMVFGVPERIVSDNGSQFVSHEYKTFLKSYQSAPFYVSRYHPQANAAEAANKTIGNAIRCYINSDHREWDRHISKIACAMNTSLHSSTQMAPYYVNFGRNMCTSGAKYATDTPDIVRDDSHFAEIRKIVADNLSKTHEISKRHYDLRARPTSYAVGDTVWKKTFPLSDAAKGFAAKLAPKYVKCTVSRKMGSNSYELKDVDGKRLGVFSAKDIKGK